MVALVALVALGTVSPCRALAQAGGGEPCGRSTGAKALFCFTAEIIVTGEKEKPPPGGVAAPGPEVTATDEAPSGGLAGRTEGTARTARLGTGDTERGQHGDRDGDKDGDRDDERAGKGMRLRQGWGQGQAQGGDRNGDRDKDGDRTGTGTGMGPGRGQGRDRDGDGDKDREGDRDRKRGRDRDSDRDGDRDGAVPPQLAMSSLPPALSDGFGDTPEVSHGFGDPTGPHNDTGEPTGLARDFGNPTTTFGTPWDHP